MMYCIAGCGAEAAPGSAICLSQACDEKVAGALVRGLRNAEKQGLVKKQTADGLIGKITERSRLGAVLRSKEGGGMPNAIRRYWAGPAPHKCDLCHCPLRGGTFVDGATTMGPWAIMCTQCHGSFGVGLGTGKGQRYEQDKDGRWPKVEG